MKTYLTYGLGIALAGAVLVYLEYFLGLHNDVDKLSINNWIGTLGGLTITIVGLFLGIRAVRESSQDKSLSYGRGVGAGALIGVFSGVFGSISTYVYGAIVNPEFHDVLYEAQVQKLADTGMSQTQIDQAEGMMRFFTGPIWMAAAALFFSPIFCVIISLILAAILKRKAPAQPPSAMPA